MLTNIIWNCMQVRKSRHKIDELEEKVALVDPDKTNAQETELRDLRCKVNFENEIHCCHKRWEFSKSEPNFE